MLGELVNGPVQAAGGVVWREVDGGVEVAIIHRDRYDDWTFPKGKLQPHEPGIVGAVREVHEETGAHGAVGRRLGWVQYEDPRGRPKTVTFWSMRYLDGDFSPNREVDELRWLRVEEAARLLTHISSHRILESFMTVSAPYSVVLLVRHGKAGKRTRWQGDDRERPLEADGRRQARLLASFGSYFCPDRILAADLVRCIQTVEPLAARLGLDVETGTQFSDESFASDPERAVDELLAVAKSGNTIVVCSQGDAIPGIIDRLPLRPPPGDVTTRKGAVWVICQSDVGGDLTISADYYPDASR
jgi:8-oxo-(d)GTP phosphatase